jgi:DNA-binding transcriptional regulator YiaG
VPTSRSTREELVTRGGRIKRARLRLDLSQKQLADRLGVSVESIGNWETGRREPQLRWRALADALEVQVEWLLDGDTEQAVA